MLANMSFPNITPDIDTKINSLLVAITPIAEAGIPLNIESLYQVWGETNSFHENMFIGCLTRISLNPPPEIPREHFSWFISNYLKTIYNDMISRINLERININLEDISINTIENLYL